VKQVDAGSEAARPGRDPESGRSSGRQSSLLKADPDGVVDDLLEAGARAPSSFAELEGHVVIEGESRPHVASIMMRHSQSVKMRTVRRSGLGAGSILVV
jgi:hypothetical protein